MHSYATGKRRCPSSFDKFILDLRLTSLSCVESNKRHGRKALSFIENGTRVRSHYSTKSFSVCQRRFTWSSLFPTGDVSARLYILCAAATFSTHGRRCVTERKCLNWERLRGYLQPSDCQRQAGKSFWPLNNGGFFQERLITHFMTGCIMSGQTCRPVPTIKSVDGMLSLQRFR